MRTQQKTICVDFENLHFGTFPDIGETNWKEINRLIQLMAEEYCLCLVTRRTGKMLEEAKLWCLNRRLRFKAGIKPGL